MTEIKLTKEQVKKLCEFKNEEARIEDAYARLFIKIQKVLVAKEAKWWKLVFSMVDVNRDTHNVVVDLINNNITITEKNKDE